MNENQKNPAELQQERDPLETETAAGRDPSPQRKGRKILEILLLLAAAWGVYRLGQYYKHRNDLWFSVILGAILVIFLSGFIVYCWKKRRAYDGFFSWGSGDWVYRNDDPITYWYYMLLYLFWDGVGVYWFFEYLPKGSV